ncbi:MAG: Uma2 family endonuclease [Gemmataceae bacterium]|nr:Uma2 family endonuclease [Gemmataceae bacterium]
MTRTLTAMPSFREDEVLIIDGMPILYEDEEEDDMGESNIHVGADEVLHVCLSSHVAKYHARAQVFSNMNLYYRNGPRYKKTGSLPYISPDNMIVEPFQKLEGLVKSYTIGRDGPAPLTVTEVLSERSAQQRDLKEKKIVCAKLGIKEYILVDETGKFLEEMLMLFRLRPDGEYLSQCDLDGGVTSELGFRLVIEADGLRVIDAATGHKYVRPMEAEGLGKANELAEKALQKLAKKTRRSAKAQRQTEAELQALQEKMKAMEEELRRLRGLQKKSNGSK